MINVPIKLTEQNWAKDTIPVVTVFCWVFNHKEFIRQSIESILMQETTFPVEIIIQDDASHDGTRQVIEEYQTQYPNLFNNIFFSENQYSQGRSIMDNLFEKPRGKYIALNHGDDYWIDTLKLQKQYLILEENRNCNIVYHNCMTIDLLGNQLNLVYNNVNFKELTLVDLLKGDFIKTCTILFKNSNLLSEKPDYLDDTLLTMLLLEKNNKAIFIPEVMSVYRVHDGGVWSMKPASERYIQSEIVENIVYDKYRKIFPNLVFDRHLNFHFHQSIVLVKSKYYKLSFNALLKYLRMEFSFKNGAKNVIKYFKWISLSTLKRR